MKKTYQLETVNFELTTACPLRCPQCYCSLKNGRHLNLDVAKSRVLEAAELGAQILLLSGGETLCYPYLYELIEFASGKIPEIRVALSGYMFDQKTFEKLVSCGVSEISISLNGSTEEINSLSRDGFSYAIESLRLLQKNQYPNTMINWVMHLTNADDFYNMIVLGEQFDVSGILIIGVKPDSKNALNTLPSHDQMVNVSKTIKNYKGKLRLLIESCYSNMLAYHSETKLFGNLNISRYKGCGAGRTGISVNVNGDFTPCRHIEKTEAFRSMQDYWEHSEYLDKLRTMEANISYPCSDCKYKPYCRHCAAINWQQHNVIQLGFRTCPIFETVK